MATLELNEFEEVDPGTLYLIKGSSIINLIAAIKAVKPLQGKNILLEESSEGIKISVTDPVTNP